MKNKWVKKKQLAAIIGVFCLVILIIAKSSFNDKNMESLGNSFTEIYNDRLVVESYVYQLNDLLYKKKITLLSVADTIVTENTREDIQAQTEKLTALVNDYSSTKLTRNEQAVFERFKNNIAGLKEAEMELIVGKPLLSAAILELCDLSITQLKLLSFIQLSEGKLLQEKSKQVLLEYNLATQLEWVVFITLLLLLVFLLRRRVVFVSPAQLNQLN